ncbi:MAG: magnesium and cobalt exporter, family [Solirubrobacteraceae bacterium]|nr:magnesium and cobalt exporter, family [Solirubrobacteraceae bacterium]
MNALLLSAVVVLILANGFFVAAEFSLVRARRARLEDMAEAGDRKARLVLAQLDDLSEYLSACQFGITLASLGIGFLGEPAIATLFEPALKGLSHAAATPIAIAIAYILVTAGHITAGEQVPKIYAIVNAEAVARQVARPLNVFNRVMRPFIHVLNKASSALLRPLGIKDDADFEEGSSPEEVRAIIAQAHAGGHLDPGEAGMLTGVFHLHEQQARQVMTPIPAVVTVDISEDVGTALTRCISTGHTRLPVTEDHNPDKVQGVVHSNSLARILMAEGSLAEIVPAIKPATIVPETKPLDDLLADLQRNRSTMAVVVDEYGRVAGIVTVEDIIEEVVGEIDDETDPTGGDVRQLANGDWYVRGHVAINDLDDYGLKLPVDSDAYNSIGGFVFDRLGRLPKRGDTVTANGYSIRVESVRENRIEAVRIRDRRSSEAAHDDEAEDG